MPLVEEHFPPKSNPTCFSSAQNKEQIENTSFVSNIFKPRGPISLTCTTRPIRFSQNNYAEVPVLFEVSRAVKVSQAEKTYKTNKLMQMLKTAH